MNDPKPKYCPNCSNRLRQVFSPPLLSTRKFTSPTAAKFSKMTETEEVSKEEEFQRVYKTIWLPPPVKHNPWEED